MIADIFKRYKDEKGRFKKSLINDPYGLLGLYEAAHLRVWEEDILDEALPFTTTHLKSLVEHLEYPLAAQVTHALERPIRKGLERLEARPFMSIYQDGASHSKALLKFAKLDFNLLQSLYKKELSNISRLVLKSFLHLNSNQQFTRSFMWINVFSQVVERPRFLFKATFCQRSIGRRVLLDSNMLF